MAKRTVSMAYNGISIYIHIMKVVYIAHPIGGDVYGNLEKIKHIVRCVNLKEKDTIPFVPYYSDVVSMDDENPIERAKGFKNNLHLIQYCDELRLYGDKISKGMISEIERAKELQIPIIPMTEETIIDWELFCFNSL